MSGHLHNGDGNGNDKSGQREGRFVIDNIHGKLIN